MRKIDVVAAAIIKDGKLLLTQRGYGEFKDKWEFPGGKIEQNETQEEAIKREIKEELNISINPEKFLCVVDHDYNTFHLTMNVYVCSILEGHVNLLEHEALKWVELNHLKDVDSIDLLPADKLVIPYLKEYFKI